MASQGYITPIHILIEKDETTYEDINSFKIHDSIKDQIDTILNT